MNRAVIVLNDATSHGGRVLTASSSMDIDGTPVALLHDQVFCPLHGDNRIIECDPGYNEGGRGVAVHGCHTACGAMLLASHGEVDF